MYRTRRRPKVLKPWNKPGRRTGLSVSLLRATEPSPTSQLVHRTVHSHSVVGIFAREETPQPNGFSRRLPHDTLQPLASDKRVWTARALSKALPSSHSDTHRAVDTWEGVQVGWSHSSAGTLHRDGFPTGRESYISDTILRLITTRIPSAMFLD